MVLDSKRAISKGNFKNARNSGCRSPIIIFKVKTDSASGKIHLPFLALGSFEASLSF